MNQESIGKFIANSRKEKGLTQAQLAEKLNITDRAVSKWETGKSMPDSSIMQELCKILGVSVNELFNGERIEMENMNQKAEETILELTRQGENNMVVKNVVALIFTILIVVGNAVCIICDCAINGCATWSRIVLCASMFAWIISAPSILLGKKGIACGLALTSIFVVPFFYVMGKLIDDTSIPRIGAVMSIISVIFMWAIFILFKFLKKRILLATGITLFAAIPFSIVINYALSKLIDEPIFDVWDFMTAFILLVLSASCIIWDYAHRKGLMK